MIGAATTRWVLFNEADQRFARLVDIKKVQITDTTSYLPDALLMSHDKFFPEELLKTFAMFGWKVTKVAVSYRFV